MDALAYRADEEQICTIINRLAAGDFSTDIQGDGLVIEALRNLAERLRSTISGSLDNCVHISMQTNEGAIATAGVLGATRDIETQAQSIAAAVEEMVTSVNQISETSQSAAGDASEVRELVGRNEQATREAVTTMSSLSQTVASTMDQAETLNKSSEEIGSIVETIDAIAKQTNLLALNATIEAARAGEAGKGFAVVAGEVKNLSNQTAKATEQIRARIEGLRSELSQIVNAMKSGVAEVDAGKQTIDHLGAEMQGMGARVARVTDRMSEIANILDQQTAASNEVAGGVSTIASRIAENVNSVESLADIMDRAQQSIGTQLTLLAEQEVPNKIIKLAKADHVIWKKRLADMAVGRETLSPDELADHHSCRLGKWYYGENAAPYQNDPAFSALEPPHALVHKSGKEAARLFAAGDIDGALREIDKVEAASKDVLRHLDTLDR